MIEATDVDAALCESWLCESEAWLSLFFDDLEDAVEGVRAADTLGIACRLSSRITECDVDGVELLEQEWVLDVLLETRMPTAAMGTISLVP